jgi:hypothetical protein
MECKIKEEGMNVGMHVNSKIMRYSHVAGILEINLSSNKF